MGREKKELTIHSALAAHHSRPLDVLMNGPMIEASERRCTLEDVDKDTFVRFCQYAYTGDYVGADPEFLRDFSATGSAESSAADAAPCVVKIGKEEEHPPPMVLSEDSPEEEPVVNRLQPMFPDAVPRFSYGTPRRLQSEKKSKGKVWSSFTDNAG